MIFFFHPLQRCRLPALKCMDFTGCENITKLPDLSVIAPNIKRLKLARCENLKIIGQNTERLALPSSIGNLTSLQSLTICSKSLEGCFFTLPNLKILCMYDFENFPKNLDFSDCLPKLVFLSVMNSNITTLPDISSRFPKLECLGIDNCCNLQKIPRLPSCMHRVVIVRCKSFDSQSSRRLLSQVHLSQRFNFG